MKNIILASQSPRRRELLTQIGLEFEVHPAGGERNHHKHRSCGSGKIVIDTESSCGEGRAGAAVTGELAGDWGGYDCGL